MQDLGSGVTLGIVDMLHQVNGLGGDYPGDSGCVTLSAGTGSWCHPGHCGHEASGTQSGCGLILETGHVTPCIWSGRESPRILQKFDPRYRVKRRLP